MPRDDTRPPRSGPHTKSAGISALTNGKFFFGRTERGITPATLTRDRRETPCGGAVTRRPEEPSGRRSPAAEVPDEVLAGQDGGADAAEAEDHHPHGVQVGRDQPESAVDQPDHDEPANPPP